MANFKKKPRNRAKLTKTESCRFGCCYILVSRNSDDGKRPSEKRAEDMAEVYYDEVKEIASSSLSLTDYIQFDNCKSDIEYYGDIG